MKFVLVGEGGKAKKVYEFYSQVECDPVVAELPPKIQNPKK